MMGYNAFISYSHAADGRLAPALQSGLERLARPWYRPRASAVFRDATGLAVSPHLWGSIVRALDDSEWFVVLCSREAAASEWVQREIDHWLAERSADRILLVLTDGDLVWDSGRRDFDVARSTALPSVLFGKFSDEPRHLDLRWARDEEQLDVRHVRFRAAVAELAAPIRNMARDELEAEDVRQHRRTMLLARGATSVLVLLLVLALTLGGLAWQQRDNARRATAVARHQANATLGEALASQAINAAHGDRIDLAMLLAVEGYRVDPSPDERSALLGVYLDQPTLERQLHGLTDTTSALAFSPDGRRLAAATVTGQLRVWDTESGRPLDRQPVVSATPASTDPLAPAHIAFADGGRILAVSSRDTSSKVRRAVVSSVDAASGRVLASISDPSLSNRGWAVSADASAIAAADATGTVQVWDLRTGRHIRSVVTGRPRGNVALSPDAKSVAMAWDWASGDAQVWNVASGRPVGPGCATGASGVDGVNLAVDNDAAVRTWGETGEGTSFALNTCHADTGALTQHNWPEFGSSFAGVTSDGNTVAAREPDGTIQLLDSRESGLPSIGDPVRAPLVIHLEPLETATVVFSPDGHLMSAIEQNGDVHLWRTTTTIWKTSRRSTAVPAAASGLSTAYEDPGGRVAVTDSGDVIDLGTHHKLGRLPDSRRSGVPSQIRLSPNRRFLALLGGDGLQLFTVDETRLRVLRTYRTVASAWAGMNGAVAFTPDSQTVVFAPAGGLVELIALNHDEPQSRTLAQPNGQLPSDVAVSRDQSLLAVTDDQGVRLWDLHASQLLGTIPIASGFGHTVSVTNRSLTVRASDGESEPSLEFDLDPASWQRRACTVANRSLTPTEWAQYLPGVRYHETCPNAP